MMGAKQYGYQVFRQTPKFVSQNEFSQLEIRLVDIGDEYSHDSVFSVMWQGDTKPRDGAAPSDMYWYGGRVELTRDSGRNYAHLMQAVKLIRRVLPKDRGWFDYQPSEFVAELDRLKIRRVVHDGRLSRFVFADNIPDVGLDKYLAMVDNVPVVGCLASDDSEARRLLIAEFAAMGWYGKLEKWLAADRPVKNTNSGPYPLRAPVAVDIDKLLELPGLSNGR